METVSRMFCCCYKKYINMKKKVSLSALKASTFLLLIISTGCDQMFENCIQGNGVEKSETRSVGGFSYVRIYGDFEVYFMQDSICSVRIDAEENLIPYILTRINGEILLIKTMDNRCLQNSKPIRIYLKLPAFPFTGLNLMGSGIIRSLDTIKTSSISLYISGSGDIKATVNTNKLNAEIAGSGNIDLSGSADVSYLNISGSGKIQAINMPQNECYADISGSGGMYVNVRQLLDVTITGSGTVYYIGAPVVQQNITGSGSIIKL